MTGADAYGEGPAFAESLVADALGAGADAAQACHVATRRFEVDAETAGVALVRTTEVEDTTLTVFRDRARGAATLTGRDPAQAARAVQNALAAARAGVPDAANGVAPGAAGGAGWHGPDEADREAMLEAVRAYLSSVSERHPQVLTRHVIYGFDDRRRSFANSDGVRRRERRGSHGFSALFGARDGARSTSFSHASASSFEPFPSLLDAGGVGRALEETVRSFDPRPVPEKFTGDLIVTPQCLRTLVGAVAGALDGYALMAGTTPFAERRGEAIASPAFSLLSRPRDAAMALGADFDAYGVPTRDVDLVVDGVLTGFLVDFFCSRKLGAEQTAGHVNLVVPPGDTPLADLVAGTERGIVLTRFSGGQPNNNLDFSGVAKNSFYVADGRIRHPLIETMVSGNLQSLLAAIRGVSAEQVHFGDGCFPYLAAGGVTISGR